MPEAESSRSIKQMLNGILDRYNSASLHKIARAWFGGSLPATKVAELQPKLVDKLQSVDKAGLGLAGGFSALQRAALLMAETRIPVTKLSVYLRSAGYTDLGSQLFELIGKGFLLVIDKQSYSKVDLSERLAKDLLYSV